MKKNLSPNTNPFRKFFSLSKTLILSSSYIIFSRPFLHPSCLDQGLSRSWKN
ncbi:hypothetical protein OROHE_002158 [Orobanche hederae]